MKSVLNTIKKIQTECNATESLFNKIAKEHNLAQFERLKELLVAIGANEYNHYKFDFEHDDDIVWAESNQFDLEYDANETCYISEIWYEKCDTDIYVYVNVVVYHAGDEFEKELVSPFNFDTQEMINCIVRHIEFGKDADNNKADEENEPNIEPITVEELLKDFGVKGIRVVRL